MRKTLWHEICTKVCKYGLTSVIFLIMVGDTVNRPAKVHRQVDLRVLRSGKTEEEVMSRSKILITGLAGACYLLLCLAAVADQWAEEEALGAAETWLALVDDGEYSESWETTAVLFRSAVTKKQWERALNAARKPLGRLIARRLKSKQYATSLPGAPDGEYVVIQYEASFENKKAAVETVTPMLDEDGNWRVSGYYIR
jgi:hypothetical protein